MQNLPDLERKFNRQVLPLLKQLQDKCKELKMPLRWEIVIDSETFLYAHNGVDPSHRGVREMACRIPKINVMRDK
jgi:hypothetical protein